MRIAITGHRPHRLNEKNNSERIYKWLRGKFGELIPEDIYTGMARGVDQIAAWCAKDNNYFYTCVFPYKHALSPEEEVLVESCARLIWCSEKYTGPRVYINRDKYMVDCADVLLAVWDGEKSGGTYETIKYAEKKGKTIYLFPWEE